MNTTVLIDIYRQAFNIYLRKGTAIEQTLQELLSKAEKTTTHYVWRTRGDDKVRGAHAANNGKIFAWDNPPQTGHPAQDYGCRCIAEPVEFIVGQKLITQVNDNPDKWSNFNFTIYYLLGRGETLNLEQIGYLKEIINYYFYGIGAYERLNLQIANAALTAPNNNFIYEFFKSYEFGSVFSGVKYSFGDAVVKGRFEGEYLIENNFIEISGIINYEFSDYFSDPSSKIESLMEEQSITREQAIAIIGNNVDEYGTPYKIIDNWQTEFIAIIKPK